ncbi:MAG TPA: BREX-3 system P-loop-containing protein BrxF [Candidatus Avacidaminococcus intestinavium]|uniref:BREX-3 system P-loop-containing protein BrxF n=1 Tax=Candidatus Avacidaminococcus intestinavium TaxID=2840684 RepID=A0A9D1MNP0_9FIRM|nr:BREX-3 system P-loop-containing protein BrxF [Candidatus Avacidaminococcus intestinavium]
MSHVEDFVKEIDALKNAEQKILIVTGKPGSGKSEIFREAAAKKAWDYVDCRLFITEEFLELMPAARKDKAAEIFGEILAGYETEVVLLDRVQTLFVPVFQINVGDLLQKLGKRFTLVVAWPGYYEDGFLCYDKFDGTESIRINADGLKIWNVE